MLILFPETVGPGSAALLLLTLNEMFSYMKYQRQVPVLLIKDNREHQP